MRAAHAHLHAWTSGEYEGEGALRVPVWPARIIVVMGSALVVISYVFYGLGGLRALLTGKAQEVEPPPASLV